MIRERLWDIPKMSIEFPPQLKKLVDHLQSKVDSSTEKKHHGKGGKQHSQPQLEWAMSYEEMQESAETIPQKWES